jgi:2-polyprenyl-3-methyl-5-hydroxy-6-metoxy-1,4-benzoquinol methylase
VDKERELPDWKQLYKDEEVEKMPWFYPGLDPDLEKALAKFHISSGTALDLGTGPATQAIALAKRGFTVTGTDLSEVAIRKARIRAEGAGLDIDFRQEDILDNTIETSFDLIFDRGLFHTIQPNIRREYIGHIHDLVRPEGHLFVKCFHHLETMEPGPYRFSPEELKDYFSGYFTILSIEETVFHGTLAPPPKALFINMKKPGI